MQSNNFQPLKSRWPQLYEHANLAERYVYSDPQTATIKLRCFAETLVGTLYRELNLPSDPGDGFFERLKKPLFEEIVDSPIRQKLHAIRYLGNKAAHGDDINTQKALQLLKEAYLLGQWLYKTYSAEIYEDYPEFSLSHLENNSTENLTELNEQLAQQLKRAKLELEEIQASEMLAQQTISKLNTSLDQAALDAFRNSSALASSTIDLDEDMTSCLISIEDVFSEYTLNNGQAELVKRLGVFLSTNTESTFLLRGYAGTGKTFITKGLTEYFRSIGRNYILAAPTGKASKVIAKKTESPAFTIHKTIYSFKDVAEYRDHEIDGTETYKFYAELAVNEMSADTVFIVDEASMVADVHSEAEFFRFGSGYLLRDFFKFVNLDHNDHRKKVIFIGDDAQLPPVGMNFSPALDANYLYREHSVRSTSYELTEVVRQKTDSGIMRNSIKLREALLNGVFNQLTVDLNYPDVTKVEYSDFMDRYLDSCDGIINGESIVIAHSNADVAAYNRRVREHFFPGCPEITAGDKVIAVNNSNAYGFFISNGDFGLIQQVLGTTEQRPITLKRKNEDTGDVESIQVSLAFRDVRIGFKDQEGNPQYFESKILEGLLDSDQAALSSDENKALYLDFCMRNNHLKRRSLEFKNTLMSDPYFNALRLKYGYAITCHKAQGSEWNKVFVKCKTNQSYLSAAYFRWFYTAITRASQKLYLLDPPNIKLGSGIKIVSSPGIALPEGITKDESTVIVEASTTNLSSKAPLNQVLDDSSVRNHKTEAVRDDVAKTFDIPAGAGFLLALLRCVHKLINDTGIIIDDIVHNQYQEAYFFRSGDDIARVDIGYNGKQRVTKLTAAHQTALAVNMIGLLDPLKNMPIATLADVPTNLFSFEEDFLNELHHRLIQITHERGISIQNVIRHQWNLRYHFTRGSEVAVYDIYFNGKNCFTKCQPVLTACSPCSLVRDVQIILTDGLSA